MWTLPAWVDDGFQHVNLLQTSSRFAIVENLGAGLKNDASHLLWALGLRTHVPSKLAVLEYTSKIIVVMIAFILLFFLLYVACNGVPTTRVRRARETGNGMPGKMQAVFALTMLLDYSCTDQYQPNMPEMARAFKVSSAQIGSTIQVHLFSCAVGTLVVGPLSDRMGRRPVILTCQLMQAAGTFTCACASSLGWFMSGRVLQGLGASVLVVIFACFRDCYEEPARRQQATGAMFSITLVGPIFAPAFGGFLASRFGFRLPFALLAGCSMLLACAGCLVIHETASGEPSGKGMAVDFYRVLNNGKRLLILLCLGACKSTFDVNIATNGVIMEEHFGQSVVQTSLLSIAFAVACAGGSVVSGCLQEQPTDVMRMFIPLMLLSSASLIVAGLYSGSIAGYLSSMSFLQLLVFPQMISYHTEFAQDLQDIAGAAVGIAFFAQYALSSVMSLPGVFAAEDSTRAMLFVLAGTVLAVA